MRFNFGSRLLSRSEKEELETWALDLEGPRLGVGVFPVAGLILHWVRGHFQLWSISRHNGELIVDFEPYEPRADPYEPRDAAARLILRHEAMNLQRSIWCTQSARQAGRTFEYLLPSAEEYEDWRHDSWGHGSLYTEPSLSYALDRWNRAFGTAASERDREGYDLISELVTPSGAIGGPFSDRSGQRQLLKSFVFISGQHNARNVRFGFGALEGEPGDPFSITLRRMHGDELGWLLAKRIQLEAEGGDESFPEIYIANYLRWFV